MSSNKKTIELDTGLLTPVAIIIAGVIIATAVYLSNGNKATTLGAQDVAQNPAVVDDPQAQAPAAPLIATVSVDDDPVLGDPKAPVTIIEFSDYECPFCKRAFEQTYPELKSKYIDTGKAKFVFRDLPLSFHDPVATQLAVAANCAREQGGDETYFKYHDALYTKTASNGQGIAPATTASLAKELGLDDAKLQSCIDSKKYEEEVKKDLADASAVGANGTPTFFIGKTTDGDTIEGTMVVGAQPISEFDRVIEAALN